MSTKEVEGVVTMVGMLLGSFSVGGGTSSDSAAGGGKPPNMAAAEEGISAGRTSMIVYEHRKIDGNPADQQIRDLGWLSSTKFIFSANVDKKYAAALDTAIF